MRACRVCVCVCVSVCLSVCGRRLVLSMSMTRSVCPSVYLSVRLSVCPSVCLSVCPSVYLSVCLSVCPSVYLSVRLSICLSMYQSIYRLWCGTTHRSATIQSCPPATPSPLSYSLSPHHPLPPLPLSVPPLRNTRISDVNNPKRTQPDTPHTNDTASFQSTFAS